MVHNSPSGDQIDAAGSQGFINKPTGPVNQTFINAPNPVIPLALQPPAPPQLFIGRQAELHQLGEWLTAVTPDLLRNGEQPEGKLALIYGPPAAGKSTLIRHWLAALRNSKAPPIIAHLSFERALLVDRGQTVEALSQTRYCLALGELDDKLPAHFPTAFSLDCYFWVTLAVQLVRQSPHLRQALERDEEWTRTLRYNMPRPPAEALTTLLACAAEERRPLIIACEGLQHCDEAWFALFKAWAKAIRSKPWPVLLLLEYDYPQPFTAPTSEAESDERLTWLRQRCGAPYFLAEACYLAHLQLHEIAALLLPGSQQYAHDLFLMSEGIPERLHDLLYAWRRQGAAHEKVPGYWEIAWVPTTLEPFLADEPFLHKPLLDIFTQSLVHSAALVTELGYEDLNAEKLREWLNHAVWEGDAFHDQALALAVGWQDDAFNDFLTIVDEALCQSAQHPHGLLAEIAESIELSYGDNQTRHLTRYRFVQPMVAVLLRQRQSPQERLRYGEAYAQALAAVYAPHHERILETLATIYQSLGLTHLAADYRQRWHMLLYLAQEAAAITELLPLAQDEGVQRSLIRRILNFFSDAYHRLHPGQLLPWLQAALAFSRHLHDQWHESIILHNIGAVYAALGEKQEALRYYNQALPFYRAVGDRRGEASTLNNLAHVYDELGDLAQAEEYFKLSVGLAQAIKHTDLQKFLACLEKFQNRSVGADTWG